MSNTPAINYTSRDYATILAALKANIQARFPNDWKDFYASGIGTALMESVAFAFDSLSFALDYTANELYLDTARDRSSVVKLGKLVGYQLRTPISASVVCRGTLATIQGIDVLVAAGTAITSKSGLPFYVVQTTTIPAGQLTADITLVQGTVYTQNFVSDGSAFQKFVLSNSPAVQDTFVITVGGDAYTQQDSLVYGDSDSKIFSVEFDADGIATVLFGDGTSGMIPPASATVVVSYRVGGGVTGNIDSGDIDDSVAGTGGVSVALVNTEPGSGGEDAETTTHAKLWIPRWIKANSRAVTEQDYDTLANVFSDPVYGAPAFAKAWLKQNIPELNTVILSCFARDNEGNITTPSAGLKAALSTYFNNDGPGAVKMICTRTEVEDGIIVYVDVDVDIKVKSDYVSATVLAAVNTALEVVFSADTNTPGTSVRISTIYNAVHDVEGVEYCIIRGITASLLSTQVIGVGNTIDKTFTGVLTLEPGVSIPVLSVRVYCGSSATEVLVDDGEGNLLDSLGATQGTVDYATGAITATFADAPGLYENVYCDYRHVVEYDRSSNAEATGDGVARRFRGSVKYGPINPFDVATATKGIAFTDGTQVVTDDGDGHLMGDVDAGGTNVIDYDTGSYDFTFTNAPALSAIVYSSYTQLLSVDSKDIPIDKSQIAVAGNLTKNAL